MMLRPRFNLKVMLIGFLLVKLCITFVFLVDTSKIGGMLLGENVAAAEEETQNTPMKDVADTKADKEVVNKGTLQNIPAEMEPVSSHELRVMIDGLEEKRIWVQNEEKRLKEKKAELELLKADIEAKVDELSRIRRELEQTLAKVEDKLSADEKKKIEMDQAKIKQLVKVYTSMKPKTAAALIDKMDTAVVLKLFSNMKGEQIGSILSYMNKDHAAEISEKLAPTKKIPPKQTTRPAP